LQGIGLTVADEQVIAVGANQTFNAGILDVGVDVACSVTRILPWVGQRCGDTA